MILNSMKHIKIHGFWCETKAHLEFGLCWYLGKTHIIVQNMYFRKSYALGVLYLLQCLQEYIQSTPCYQDEPNFREHTCVPLLVIVFLLLGLGSWQALVLASFYLPLTS